LLGLLRRSIEPSLSPTPGGMPAWGPRLVGLVPLSTGIWCDGASEAPPRTADCCSRSAQIFSNTATSTQSPPQRSHSRIASAPILTEDISILQRGHFKADSCAGLASAAAAPQWGQCRLPINIIAKQDVHAIVASFDSQYRHCGESEETAAPQFGQVRVCASMSQERTSCVRFAGILPARDRSRPLATASGPVTTVLDRSHPPATASGSVTLRSLTFPVGNVPRKISSHQSVAKL